MMHWLMIARQLLNLCLCWQATRTEAQIMIQGERMSCMLTGMRRVLCPGHCLRSKIDPKFAPQRAAKHPEAHSPPNQIRPDLTTEMWPGPYLQVGRHSGRSTKHCGGGKYFPTKVRASDGRGSAPKTLPGRNRGSSSISLQTVSHTKPEGYRAKHDRKCGVRPCNRKQSPSTPPKTTLGQTTPPRELPGQTKPLVAQTGQIVPLSSRASQTHTETPTADKINESHQKTLTTLPILITLGPKTLQTSNESCSRATHERVQTHVTSSHHKYTPHSHETTSQNCENRQLNREVLVNIDSQNDENPAEAPATSEWDGEPEPMVNAERLAGPDESTVIDEDSRAGRAANGQTKNRSTTEAEWVSESCSIFSIFSINIFNLSTQPDPRP